jgi:uncharacterized protein YjbI with pentapeptide repeats
MANGEHLEWVLQGKPWEALKMAQAFNTRLDLRGADLSSEKNLCGAPLAEADLSDAKLVSCDLSHAFLNSANLRGANLDGAKLIEARLMHADLTNANLTNARLMKADLSHATLFRANLAEAHFQEAILENADLFAAYCPATKFVEAKLAGASLRQAHLFSADLTGAKLMQADLSFATLVKSILDRADLTGANIYGISAWDVKLNGTTQVGLKIVPPQGGSIVTVDDLEVAQFIHMLLNNEKVRQVIDAMTSKVVLILGRFSDKPKAVLEALRKRLRQLDFVPVMFDFEKAKTQDFTETIKTLAGLSQFIIADITNPKSSPLELQAVVPDYMVPLIPILHEEEEPFSMFQDLQNKYGGDEGWVLDVLQYGDVDKLISVLEEAVVQPAQQRARKLRARKARAIRKRHVEDYSKTE